MKPVKGLIYGLLVLLICVSSISSAVADRDGGEHKGERHGGGHQGRGGRGNHQGYGNDYRPGFRQPHYNNYAQPIYVPPPVYYQPQRSPGIELFFPLTMRW